MKRNLFTLALLLTVAWTCRAHDMNGGGWEHDEDLSGNGKIETADLDPYAQNDANLYIRKHPAAPIKVTEKMLAAWNQLGVDNAVGNHHITDGDTVKAYADEFVRDLEWYYEAK